jgi:vacuolar-type H+-ATPase catalytic subunit A/Vma1
MTRVQRLYDDDFYAWSVDQARALRRVAAARPNDAVDWPHVIEEVRDLGKDRRDAVRSQIRRVIEHALKLEHSRAREPRPGWLNSIDDAREQLADRLTRTLRRDVERQLPVLYAQVARRVRRDLESYGEASSATAIPATCAYALDDLLDPDWYPDPPSGA